MLGFLRRGLRFLPIALLLLACVLFYWKLALTNQYVWFDHPDMCYIEIPRLQFQAREMHAGRFALWDPCLWMGQPLIGQTQPGPVFPLNLLFLLLPLHNGYLDFRLLNWYYVMVHFIAAVCAYALCRDLRRSRTASVFAALAFAFAGFLGSVAWLDVINGAIWTPAIFLFFLRAARGIRPWRNAPLCGLFIGLAWLSGHHEVPMLVSYVIAGGWAYAIRRRGRRAIVPAVATFVLAGLVAAVQLWPTYEFARLSERWVGLERSYKWNQALPYTAPTVYSMPVKGITGMFLYDSNSYADSTPFLGVVVVALAIYGAARAWRSAAVRWMTALAIVGAVFSLGALTPVHGWLFSFAPMLGKARVPVRAIHLLNFAAVVLAAYGLDAVLTRRRVRAVAVGVGALSAVVFIGTIWRKDMPETMLWTAIVAAVFACVLIAYRRGALGTATCAGAIVALMVLEVYPVTTAKYGSRHSKDGLRFVRTLTENMDIVEFLRREPSPRRLVVNDGDIPTNFGDWHGFDAMEGYVAGVTENVLGYGRHTKPVQELLGITHYVGRTPDKPGLIEAFRGASGIAVYRNPTALPRAWSAHVPERAHERWQIGERINQPGVDPRRTVISTEALPELEDCAGDDVSVVAYAPNRVRVRASMQCRGIVNLSDTYYPGWEAKIDGRPARMFETYGALRGVLVDAGDHTVEFVYRPRSVIGGAVLSALGLLGIAAIVLLDSRRRRL